MPGGGSGAPSPRAAEFTARTRGQAIANLFAEVLVSLAPDLLRVSSKHLVLAGILNEKADSVLEALAPMTIRDRTVSEAWTCLHLERQ